MCGIAGVFTKSKKRFSDSTLKGMAQAISHRGPDDEGFFIAEHIALAHRRLAILDTSKKGSQPMRSRDGEWIVIFNGCLYNFPEIKQELQSKGYIFSSTTDTEIITEGLSEYGPSIFERFNGMFAIAAWNTKEKALYLSRDRYGIKPLYYWFNSNEFVFASEIKSILKHPNYKISVDHGALNEYFTFQNLFSYRTLFKDIFLLPQANTIRIDQSTKNIEHNSWWDYDFSSPDEDMTFEDAEKTTLKLFKQAVKRQMIADVPVGSYLSGGLDSGSITGIAAGHVDRLSTFTCGFDMSEVTGIEANYDERRMAEYTANYFKTEHFEQVVNAGDLKWSLPKVVWHIEDLRVGMSYPNYYIARLASKFVKVCLQGTGGDELFGGYPWRYYHIFDSLSPQQFYNQYYNYWQRLVSEEEKTELFQNHVLNSIDIKEPRKIFERVFTFNQSLKYDRPEDYIQNSLYFEIKTFLPGLLIVGDKLSMANGLEERFPFLDNDLVEFAQKIPLRHKLGDLRKRIKKIDENVEKKKRVYEEFNDGKNVLRKAMREVIPQEVLNRKKQGFSSPDESWYRGENAAYVKEILMQKDTVSKEFIRPEYMKKIVDEHIHKKKNHRLLIWSFMNFEIWCRLFLK